MEVPRLEKVTLNMGVGEAIADRKVMEHAVSDMTAIAGQSPVVCLQGDQKRIQDKRRLSNRM